MTPAGVKLDRFLDKAIRELSGDVSPREVPMTPKLQGLASKLRHVTQSIEDRAVRLADRLDSVDQKDAEAHAKVHTEIDKIEDASRGLDDFANQVSNGGPPLDGSK